MTITYAFTPLTDPVARGRSFGAAYVREIGESWRGYLEFFRLFDLDDADVRAVADTTYARVEGWAPTLAAEMGGLAEGAGLERWQVAALNARSEVIAAFRIDVPGECSTTVFVPSSGPPLTLQSWDWNERMTEVKVVHCFETAAGRGVKTFTEFGILGKIGVNSAGLGVHFNLLQHERDGVPGGVPVHLVARRILDEASCLDEAREIVSSATATASAALTVVTYDGERADAATFELSPAGSARVAPDGEGQLLRTNHFLDARLARGERHAAEDDGTYRRREVLERRREALRSPSLVDRATALVHHAADGAAICAHVDEAEAPRLRWRTQAMISLDLESGRLRVRDGQPCVGDLTAWNVV